MSKVMSRRTAVFLVVNDLFETDIQISGHPDLQISRYPFFVFGCPDGMISRCSRNYPKYVYFGNSNFLTFLLSGYSCPMAFECTGYSEIQMTYR